MNPIKIERNWTEEEVIHCQRSFRHQQYMKRVSGKSEAYKTAIFVREIKDEDKPKISAIIKFEWQKRFSEIVEKTAPLAKAYCISMVEKLSESEEFSFHLLGAFDKEGVLQAISMYRIFKDSHINILFLISVPRIIYLKTAPLEVQEQP